MYPALWLNITLWLSTDHHDRPRTPVRVTALPQPAQDVWYPPLQDPPPPPSQWPRVTAAPHAEGRHHVPRG
jgi:hypothetical protein